MKLLFISRDKEKAGRLFRYFTPLGYGVIHYANPLKAMDNYGEIRPEAVVFHETDFPRHWKLGVQFLRERFTKETALFILMTGEEFPGEDLHKAHILGVNGVLRTKEDFGDSLKSLESLILHYKPSPSVRKTRGLLPLGDQSMDLMFMNPENLQLVTARILELSQEGCAVKPTEPLKTAGLKEGMTIKGCSLKTGDIILSLTVRIVQIQGFLELVFLEGNENWREQVRSTMDSYD